jgi:hypothetical protein
LGLSLSQTQRDSLDKVAEVLVAANGLIAAVETTTINASAGTAQALSDAAVSALRGIVAVQQVVQSTATDTLQAYLLDPSNTAAVDLLLASSGVQGSLGNLAANTIVGPILPSRFKLAVASSEAPDTFVESLEVFEGTASGADQSVSFTITREGGLDGTVVIQYTVSGSATLSAARFVGLSGSTLPAGQIKFGPGETEKTIQISFVNDSVDQTNELIVFKITDVYGNSQFARSDGSLLEYGEARVLLRDDDPNTPLIVGPTADNSSTPAIEAANKLTLLAQTPTSLPALKVDYFDPTATLQASIRASGAVLNAPGILQPDGAGQWRIVTTTPSGLSPDLNLDQLNSALARLSQALALEASPSANPSAAGSLTLSVSASARAVAGSYQLDLDIRHPPTLTIPQAFQAVTAKTASTLLPTNGSSPFSLSDTDSSNLSVIIESDQGALTLGSAAEVFTTKTSNGLSLSGSASAITAALGTLQFSANAGISSAALRITVSDADPFTDADGIANNLDWSNRFRFRYKQARLR